MKAPKYAVLVVLVAFGACSSESAPPGSIDAGADASPEAQADVSEPDVPEGDGPGPDLPPPAPASCNPLATEYDCLLPFPSDAFLVTDGALPSGKRVVVPDAALPMSTNGVFDPFPLYPADGFSIGAQILALFPGGVDDASLTHHYDDVSATIEGTSTTLLIEAASNDYVLHFADLDPAAETDTRRAMTIRPMVRLKHERRYIVAIRGLLDPTGAPVPAPEGFAALRDGVSEDAALQARYEAEIFPHLETLGVERGELQLAWDFTTGSQAHTMGDALAMRELALAFESSVTVDSVEEPEGEDRVIRATVTVPMFLESLDTGSPLVRDGSGALAAPTEGSAEVTILVPRSVLDAPADAEPAGLLQFGHGVLASRDEMLSGWMRQVANEAGLVVFSTNWIGLAEPDTVAIIENLVQRRAEVLRFTDGFLQTMVNGIVLTSLFEGELLTEPSLQRDGAPLYDPSFVGFYGLSLGHLMGAAYVPLNPHIDRAVFASGGVGFGVTFSRSGNFFGFHLVFEQILPDQLAILKSYALGQHVLDRADGLTYAPWTLREGIDGEPVSREVLVQLGVGDSQFTNLAGHLHARALGLPLAQPAPREVPFLSTVKLPAAGSALAEYDFGIDPLPGVDPYPAPEDVNTVHEDLRRTATARAQAATFLRSDGKVAHTCDEVCDPE